MHDRLSELAQKFSTYTEPWSAVALAFCLSALAKPGGAIRGDVNIAVHDAWFVDEKVFCVVDERSDFCGLLGIIRGADSRHVDAWGELDDNGWPAPAIFGSNVAGRDIEEPLGSYVERLSPDSDGIHWWGDPDFY